MIPALLASVAAPLIGGIFGAMGQAGQNAENRAASAKQMSFQERMIDKQMAFQTKSRGDQYQTAMGDMKKAGLNPLLAYKQGGAGTLSGSTASGSTYQAGNVGAAAMEGASSAVGTETAKRLQDLQVDRAGAEVDIANQTARNLIDQRSLIKAQTVASGAQAARESATTKILHQDLQTAKAAATVAKSDEDFYKTEAGQNLRKLERIFDSVLPGSQTVKNVR